MAGATAAAGPVSKCLPQQPPDSARVWGGTDAVDVDMILNDVVAHKGFTKRAQGPGGPMRCRQDRFLPRYLQELRQTSNFQ